MNLIRKLLILFVVLVTVVAGALFALQNTALVPLDLLVYTFEAQSLALWVLSAFATGGVLGIDVEGGCHQLFGLGGCFEVEDDVGFPIVSTYALAFARRHVLFDDDATVVGIVDGEVEVSDLVRFERK